MLRESSGYGAEGCLNFLLKVVDAVVHPLDLADAGVHLFSARPDLGPALNLSLAPSDLVADREK